MSKKYKILAGAGVHRDATDDNKARYYSAGEIIETDDDLLALNGRGMAPKYQQLVDERPLTEADIERRIEEDRKRLEAMRSKAKGAVPESLKGTPPPRNKEEFHAALNKMTPAELKKLAVEDMELDVGNATTKEQLIAIIKKASA